MAANAIRCPNCGDPLEVRRWGCVRYRCTLCEMEFRAGATRLIRISAEGRMRTGDPEFDEAVWPASRQILLLLLVLFPVALVTMLLDVETEIFGVSPHALRREWAERRVGEGGVVVLALLIGIGVCAWVYVALGHHRRRWRP